MATELQWQALERSLAYANGRIDLPADDGERAAVLVGLERVGWLEAAPADPLDDRTAP